MELPEIIKHIDAVSIPENAKITQLKHEEDDEPYQVWRIDSDDAKYILKEAKENEYEIHQSIFAELKEGVPAPKVTLPKMRSKKSVPTNTIAMRTSELNADAAKYVPRMPQKPPARKRLAARKNAGNASLIPNRPS